MELKRVVVTGLGAVTPLGNTPEETWENMVKGVSGAAPITLFDATGIPTSGLTARTPARWTATHSWPWPVPCRV